MDRSPPTHTLTLGINFDNFFLTIGTSVSSTTVEVDDSTAGSRPESCSQSPIPVVILLFKLCPLRFRGGGGEETLKAEFGLVMYVEAGAGDEREKVGS